MQRLGRVPCEVPASSRCLRLGGFCERSPSIVLLQVTCKCLGLLCPSVQMDNAVLLTLAYDQRHLNKCFLPHSRDPGALFYLAVSVSQWHHGREPWFLLRALPNTTACVPTGLRRWLWCFGRSGVMSVCPGLSSEWGKGTKCRGERSHVVWDRAA